jgi:ABC-type uncharacterized transport system ATPase subunit
MGTSNITGALAPSPQSTTPTTASVGTPVSVAAPVVKETAAQKFDSFINGFGHKLEEIVNVGENVAIQESTFIESLLPPAEAKAFAIVVSTVGKQLAAVEAKYAAIGQSTVPEALKIAEAVAVSGESVLQTLASVGISVTAGNLTTLFGGLGQALSVLNISTLTKTPVVPTT